MAMQINTNNDFFKQLNKDLFITVQLFDDLQIETLYNKLLFITRGWLSNVSLVF